MIVFGIIWLVEINYVRISLYLNAYPRIQLIHIIVMWLDPRVMEQKNALKFSIPRIALYIP